jgi:hypothetical protein
MPTAQPWVAKLIEARHLLREVKACYGEYSDIYKALEVACLTTEVAWALVEDLETAKEAQRFKEQLTMEAN